MALGYSLRNIFRLGLNRPSAELVNSLNKLDLYYWKSSDGVNFGDYLSSVVVTKIAADHGFFIDEELAAPKRLLAVGSVLHFARDDDIIWGSGVNGKVDPQLHTFKRLDVRAVRGPLTRDFLRQRGVAVPEIYGDPALLLPILLPERFKRDEFNAKGTWVVPNLHDLAAVSGLNNVISPLQRWSKVIDKIINAEFIISSSLHGLVIADAFGVPCRYVRLSQIENIFKYNDYAQGVGRTEFVYASSISEAEEMGPMPPVTVNVMPLLNAFPFDIWQG